VPPYDTNVALTKAFPIRDTVPVQNQCRLTTSFPIRDTVPVQNQCRLTTSFPIRDHTPVVAGFHPGQPSVAQLRHPYPAYGHDRPSQDTSRAEPRSVVYGAWNYSRVRWSSYPAVSSRLSPGRRLTHRPSRRTVFRGSRPKAARRALRRHKWAGCTRYDPLPSPEGEVGPRPAASIKRFKAPR